MPDDPRLGKYMEELGYNPVQFPFFQGTRQGRQEPPHVYARRQAMRSLANIASALLQKGRTAKNVEAKEKAEQRITAEDRAALMQQINALRQEGLEELARSAMIAGELPKIKDIENAREKLREEAETARNIATFQANLPDVMPMETVPRLAEDTGFPEGPMSLRPETAMRMASDVGAGEDVFELIRGGRQAGGRFTDYLESFVAGAKETTPKQTMDAAIMGIDERLKRGEITWDQASAEADRVRRFYQGRQTPEELFGTWYAKGEISEQKLTLRQQKKGVFSAYEDYAAAQQRKWDVYQRDLATWQEKQRVGLPPLMRGPKPVKPKPTKDLDGWLHGEGGRAIRQAYPDGYQSYIDEIEENKAKLKIKAVTALQNMRADGIDVVELVQRYYRNPDDFENRGVTLALIAEIFEVDIGQIINQLFPPER